MKAFDWKTFFEIAIKVLGEGEFSINNSLSWCSFTTYSRLLSSDAGYWQAGLPKLQDIGENGTLDSGIWLNPIPYDDIAHILIPEKFLNDRLEPRIQDIERLALVLDRANINYHKIDGLLEVKLY